MQFNIKHTLLLFFFGIFLLSCKTTSTLTSYSNTSVAYAKDFQKHLEPNGRLLNSWYNYTVEQTHNRKYILKIYYPEKKTMTSRVEYSNSNLTIKDGKYSSYSDEGELQIEGSYIQNKETGEWKSYHWGTRVLSKKGNYILGKQEDIWTEYDTLGVVSATYTYEEGKKNGPYQVFKDGKLYESGKFLYGDVVNTKMVTEGTESILTQTRKEVDRMPEYPGCDPDMNDVERGKCSINKMLQFINSNIQYPEKARQLDIEGSTFTRFLVDKDGSIKEIEVTKGICAPIAEECIRIVKMMPKWKPGEQDGKAVPVYFNLPIKFNLE